MVNENPDDGSVDGSYKDVKRKFQEIGRKYKLQYSRKWRI